MWLFLSCTKPITRHFPFFSSKWDENWFKLNIFVLGAVIFGVPNIILLLSYLAFSTRQQGIKLKSKELKSLRYFHFDQWIIELKLNFSFKARQLETCKHQWTHLNKLKIRFTYNFFFLLTSFSQQGVFSVTSTRMSQNPLDLSRKNAEVKELEFYYPQWAILCLMQNSSVQHSKARNNTGAYEIYLPNFYWFSFSLLADFLR